MMRAGLDTGSGTDCDPWPSMVTSRRDTLQACNTRSPRLHALRFLQRRRINALKYIALPDSVNAELDLFPCRLSNPERAPP
jgi:hypothetical protein